MSMPTRPRRLSPMPAIVIVSAALCGAAAAHAAAQAPGPARLTPRAAISLRHIADLQWSPDGSRLAFTVTEPPHGAERQTHVWLWERASGAVRQYTNSPKSERHPRWSPDGSMLAFLSDRDERTQIYLLRTGGGEAWALTSGKAAVRDFEWSPDGTRIAYLAPEAVSDALAARQKDKDDARVVDFDDRPAHLWTVDVPSGRVTVKWRSAGSIAFSCGASLSVKR